MKCLHCGERIEPGQRFPSDVPLHFVCGVRGIVGSVAHIERRCGCYIEGSHESDPPHMTLRQAAIAACRAHELQKVRN